jgi:endo-1,4-beta-xylanase
MQPERGQWNFTAADLMMDLARDHGLSTHGFHWMWSQTLLDSNPEWFEDIVDRDELWAVLEEHLAMVVERYPDLGRINVVNEPLELASGQLLENQFHQVLGPDYLAEAFRRARAIAPDDELFINDNLTEYNADKAAGLVELVTALVDDGVPIDGVGFQTHLVAGDPDWELFEDTMRRIGDLGLTVSVTELDAPTEVDLDDRDEVQAERMAGVVEVCLAVEACDSVIIWGVHDGNTWIDWFLRPGMNPLLFTEDLQPKPSYDAVLATLQAAGEDGS